MKFSLSLFLLALFVNLSQAQPWLKNLPDDRSRGELTLFDYQRAFEEYWAPFGLDNGYYFEDGKKKKAVGWKQFKRWEYDMQSQVDPVTGAFPKKSAYEVLAEFQKNNPPRRSEDASNWSTLGPFTSRGGYGGVGRINCIAFHPSDMQTYWVGAPAGGIWVTHNNGSGWTSLTDKLAQIGVSDIAIPSDYDSTQTIYIATGDRDSWDTRSIGVLKSTDNGKSWEPTGLSYTISDDMMVNRLLIDPVNPNTLLAATTQGVFKTTDGGIDWDSLVTPIQFIDMEFKPGNSKIVYGSTKDGRIYASYNNGNAWTAAFYHSTAARIEMAVTPHNPQYVYAIASNADNGLHSILQSTNSGLSFTEVYNGSQGNLLSWEAENQDDGGQAYYDLCIAASPNDANTVLIGGINTWRSQDGGKNWEIVNHWVGHIGQEVHADKHNLVYRSNGDLFECNDGGVYISHDDGTFWIDRTHGIAISQMYRLGISATDPDVMIMGLQDNGTKVHSGPEWFDIIGGDGMECLVDYTDPDIQYGTLYYGTIERTMDHWQSSWNVSAPDDGGWVTPFVIDPQNPSVLYGGYTNVWMTDNRGDWWTAISDFGDFNTIKALAVATVDTPVLYVSSNGYFKKSTDLGVNWIDLGGNIPFNTSAISYITVKENDPNTLWITRTGFSNSGVYQSTDGGETWQDISVGLPPIPVHCIVRNEQIPDEHHLYAGTEVGVYYKNGDAEWVAFNNKLPNVKVNELEIYYDADPELSKMRAATYGRGLWETGLIFKILPPAAGVAQGDSAICFGNSAFILLAEHFGSIRWQDSTSADTAWSYVESGSGDFTPAFTTDALSENTYFRAEITQPGFDPVYSNEVLVIVKPVPPAPVITADLDYLISDATEGEHQWYDEEGPVEGAVNADFLATVTGNYYVIVTLDGCSSPPSNVVEVLLTGINDPDKNQPVTLYPNPVGHELTIELPGNTKSTSFEIYSPNGQLVEQGKVKDKTVVKTSALIPGNYILRFENGRSVEFVKMK